MLRKHKMIYSFVAAVLLPLLLAVPTFGRVVHIRGTSTYNLTYEQAQSLCSEMGGSLATYGDLLDASRNGISYCACGWIADKTARFPMNYSHPHCNDGPGVHLCGNRERFDGFCYLGGTSKCFKPLGMEKGTIPDRQISASSAYTLAWSRIWSPEIARLNHKDIQQYLQIDLGRPMIITGILTRGVSRWTRGQYVTKFRVAFSKDGIDYHFQYNGDVHKIFGGNYDDDSVVRNTFDPVVQSQYFRFYPYSWEKRPAVRMELLGCKIEEYNQANIDVLDVESLK